MSKRILFGVTGGIAAFKACALISALVQKGYEVDVILTEEALRFVTPLSFEALTRRRVWTSLWQAPEEIPHIALVRNADIFVIVPATAHTIAKLALGLADDLLTNAALAARIPIVLAPAMNTVMYEHAATREHLASLCKRGVTVVEPECGFLAERENGVGRLASQEMILQAVERVLTGGAHATLRGRRVLITAGPTREAIDPVRFLSNAASGATGIALARAAVGRGASVSLVLGPTALSVPSDIDVQHVTTAQEMYEAAANIAQTTPPHLVIATAAVADERPRQPFAQKQKKRNGELRVLELEPTIDVVAELRKLLPEAIIVGFAAETTAHEENAREKLLAKHLDAVVVNDVTDGTAFGPGENMLILLTRTRRQEIGKAEKSILAARLLDVVEELLP